MLADANTGFKSEDGFNVISVPDNASSLPLTVHTVLLKLLSYQMAIAKGTDLDKSQNLAKQVTWNDIYETSRY